MAELYVFDLGDRIPTIPIPLQSTDSEPTLDIQEILNELYEQLGYSDFIDYQQEPPAPWSTVEIQTWISESAANLTGELG
jgi:hypothetical protein